MEKHNDSLKHVYLNKKNARLDVVVQNLYGVHLSIKRQFEIETSRQTPNSNKSTGQKDYFLYHKKDSKGKKRIGKGYYQSPPRVKIPQSDELPIEWRNISVMECGGETKDFFLPNTCTVDNFLLDNISLVLIKPRNIKINIILNTNKY